MTSSTFPWDISEYRLANGLRVVVSPDRSVPIAAVNLWYNAGSRHDPVGGHGFAHLFEHLMFEGSAHVGAGEHRAMLSAIGGSGINATTTMDRANFFQTVPVSGLALALWLEADRMGGLLLSQENIDNQVSVVRNERLQQYDNAPYGRWLETSLASVFPGEHPYAHGSIGSPSDLDRSSLDALSEFRRRYYTPANAVLTVVGDVTPADVLDKAQTYFGGIPAGSARYRPVPAEKWEMPGSTAWSQPDHKAALARVYFVHRIPAAFTADHAALTIMAAVLGRGRGSRLYRTLMADQGLAQPEEKSAFAWDLAYGSSIFTIGMTVQRGVEPKRLTATATSMIDEMATARVPASELARAKAVLTASWLRSITPFGSRADMLARHAAQQGRAAAVRDWLDQLAGVSADDLSRVAGAYLRPDNRFVLTVDPATEEPVR